MRQLKKAGPPPISVSLSDVKAFALRPSGDRFAHRTEGAPNGAGFAAILMSLRDMRGSGMSRFHLWVARSYVQSGLVTAMNALLSPLLFGLGLSERMTWQVASAIIAAQSIVLIVLVPGQWRAATRR